MKDLINKEIKETTKLIKKLKRSIKICSEYSVELLFRDRLLERRTEKKMLEWFLEQLSKKDPLEELKGWLSKNDTKDDGLNRVIECHKIEVKINELQVKNLPVTDSQATNN